MQADKKAKNITSSAEVANHALNSSNYRLSVVP